MNGGFKKHQFIVLSNLTGLMTQQLKTSRAAKDSHLEHGTQATYICDLVGWWWLHDAWYNEYIELQEILWNSADMVQRYKGVHRTYGLVV